MFMTLSCNDDQPYTDPDPLPDDDDPSAPIIPDVDILATAQQLWAEEFDASTFVDAVETVPTDSLTQPDYEDFFENSSMYTDGTRDVIITYRGDTATWKFEDDDKHKTEAAVKISARGAHVTVRNDEGEGRARINYILRGETDNGSLRVYSAKKFLVTLDDVTLCNREGSAINVQKVGEKKRMFLCMEDGSDNYLCDAAQYTDTVPGEDEKGTIFSEGKIILMGKGRLHVSALCSHAIASDDDIRIHSGVEILVDSCRKDGIHAKDGIVMSGGMVKILARKDAIQCDTISKGFTLTGGRLLAAAKRGLTANPFIYDGGEFSFVAVSSQCPTSGSALWTKEEHPEGYVEVKGK